MKAALLLHLDSAGSPVLPAEYGTEFATRSLPASAGPDDVRAVLGGRPYAVFAHGDAVPAAIALAGALHATDPCTRLFLADGPELSSVDSAVPLTYFHSGGPLPAWVRAWPGVTVRPSVTPDVIVLGFREDLGIWEPASHYMA